MHYHTKSEETFKVIEGEFTVFIGKRKLTFTKGQSTPKIKTNENHYFKNSSQKNVVSNIIFERGHVGIIIIPFIFALIYNLNHPN
jgi:uncharacterized cupin superfamily protein